MCSHLILVKKLVCAIADGFERPFHYNTFYILRSGSAVIQSAQMAEWLWRVTQAIASAFNVVYSRREICKGSNPFLSNIIFGDFLVIFATNKGGGKSFRLIWIDLGRLRPHSNDTGCVTMHIDRFKQFRLVRNSLSPNSCSLSRWQSDCAEWDEIPFRGFPKSGRNNGR